MSRGSWRFFVRTPNAEAGWGFFERRVGLSSRTRGMGVGVVTVFFSRLSSRSFHDPRGCTPTHPFVNTSAEYGSRPGPKPGPDTEDSLRPSRTARPSQSGLRSAARRSPRGTSDWPGRRGLLPQRGRADATVTPCFPRWSSSFFQGFPRAPSAFAVASALTLAKRMGTRRRRRWKGRTPSVEPERRSTATPLGPAVSAAVDRPSRRAAAV